MAVLEHLVAEAEVEEAVTATEIMDEAVAWVKRCPNPMRGPSEIEIRPLYEMADLRQDSDAGSHGNP
jgi:hypothetical protein